MYVEGEAGPQRSGSNGLTLKYCAVSFCGLAVNIALLRLLTWGGLQAAYAQPLSLLAAVQATFWLNALIVFRSVQMRRWFRHWLAYMGASGLGLICNDLIFTTLLSLHKPLISTQLFAVCTGGFVAWVVNYNAARLVVFNSKLHRWIGALFSGPDAAASGLKVKP